MKTPNSRRCPRFILFILAIIVIPSVSLAAIPDQYEYDNVIGYASYIDVDETDDCLNRQIHNLHDPFDIDWIYFTINDTNSEAKIFDVWGCAVWVELYYFENLAFPLFDYYGEINESISIPFESFEPGYYYVKIQRNPNYQFTEPSDYSFCVVEPGVNPAPTYVEGFVKDAFSGTPIEGAAVNSNYGITVNSVDSGYYLLAHEPGVFSFTASASGYRQETFQNINVPEGDLIRLDFDLTPVVNLEEVINALQVLAGSNPPTPPPSTIDLGDDNKISLEEVILYMQILSNKR